MRQHSRREGMDSMPVSYTGHGLMLSFDIYIISSVHKRDFCFLSPLQPYAVA